MKVLLCGRAGCVSPLKKWRTSLCTACMKQYWSNGKGMLSVEGCPCFKSAAGCARSRMPAFRQRTVWRLGFLWLLAHSWTSSNFSFKSTDWAGTCAITCSILTRSAGGEQLHPSNCLKWLFANDAHPAGSSKAFSLLFSSRSSLDLFFKM